MKAFLALLAALWLAGCGSGMEGTWSDRLGAMQYRFKPGGTVSVVVMGIATELKYTIDGRHVTILSPRGNQVLDLQADGTLAGPLGMRFTRQD